MSHETVRDLQLETLMRATRALSGVTAASLAQVDDKVTPQQLRVLVLVGTHPRTRPSDVAAALDIRPSSATRLCDRLVAAGRLLRREDPDDRRRTTLHLTPGGRRLLMTVHAHRRRRLSTALDNLPRKHVLSLCQLLGELSDVLGEPA